MKIKKKISFFNTLLNNSSKYKFLLEDSIGLLNLKPFMDNYPYIPITEKALRPICLNFIINEIFINARNNIIEFGSGISTIIIGRVLQHIQGNQKLLSFEHDKEWHEFISSKLKDEQLDDFVEILYAPLVKSDFQDLGMKWYDKSIVTNSISNYNPFDLLIVDGPPAYQKENFYSRMIALPSIVDRLSSNYCIILDDALRKGEKYAIKEWEKLYGLKFSVFFDSLAVAYKGSHFVSTPVE